MIRPFSFIAVGLVAAMAAQASAGVIIYTLPRNNQADLNPSAGQTFTTGTLGTENQLSTIEIAGPSSSSGTFVNNVHQIHIFVDTDANPTTWDPGTSVAVSTNSGTLPVGGTRTFTFSNELLSDSTVYALLFETTGGTAQGARVGLTGSNPLAGGTVFASGTQQFSGNYDLAFSVTTVPEPGSLALLGLGLAGLIGIRRRRR